MKYLVRFFLLVLVAAVVCGIYLFFFFHAHRDDIKEIDNVLDYFYCSSIYDPPSVDLDEYSCFCWQYDYFVNLETEHNFRLLKKKYKRMYGWNDSPPLFNPLTGEGEEEFSEYINRVCTIQDEARRKAENLATIMLSGTDIFNTAPKEFEGSARFLEKELNLTMEEIKEKEDASKKKVEEDIKRFKDNINFHRQHGFEEDLKIHAKYSALISFASVFFLYFIIWFLKSLKSNKERITFFPE